MSRKFVAFVSLQALASAKEKTMRGTLIMNQSIRMALIN